MTIIFPRLAQLLEVRMDSDSAEYQFDAKKGHVIAKLKSYDSQRYTKLAQKFERIDTLEKEVKELKAQTKAETKEYVVELFNAEDAIHTRIVETVSFVFKLTKDPKATETVAYAKVLGELEAKLTPELIKVLDELKKKYTSTTQKEPALSLSKVDPDAVPESVMEGLTFWERIKDSISSFAKLINFWGKRYDAKLEKLRQMV